MDSISWDLLRKDKRKVMKLLGAAGLSPAHAQLRWGSLTKSNRDSINNVAKGKGWHEEPKEIVTKKGMEKKAPEHHKAATKKSFELTMRKPIEPTGAHTTEQDDRAWAKKEMDKLEEFKKQIAIMEYQKKIGYVHKLLEQDSKLNVVYAFSPSIQEIKKIDEAKQKLIDRLEENLNWFRASEFRPEGHEKTVENLYTLILQMKMTLAIKPDDPRKQKWYQFTVKSLKEHFDKYPNAIEELFFQLDVVIDTPEKSVMALNEAIIKTEYVVDEKWFIDYEVNLKEQTDRYRAGLTKKNLKPYEMTVEEFAVIKGYIDRTQDGHVIQRSDKSPMEIEEEHIRLIVAAMKDGLTVPERVLKEYPATLRKYQKQPT